MQITLPNGGITTLDTHEIPSFAMTANPFTNSAASAGILFRSSVLADPGNVAAYLRWLKTLLNPGVLTSNVGSASGQP